MQRLLAAACALWFLCSPSFAGDGVPVGERLRLAWIAHRILGDLDRAEEGYRALSSDDDVFPDVRARAAIGLALVHRKRGRLEDAQRVLESVRSVPGVSRRWQVTARRELFRIPDREPDTDPITQLDTQVKTLERERAQLVERTGEVDEKLERTTRLYSGLRGFVVGEGAALAGPNRAALDLLDSLASELRETERYRKTVIEARLALANRLHDQGQFVRSLNEAKRVLKVDPSNEQAERLRQKCQVVLSSLTSSPGSAGRPFERELTREMRRRYEEARDDYREGRLSAAIQGLDQLLSWYTFSAEPIADSDVTRLIRPAERLIRECFQATRRPDVAARLSDRSRKLRRELEVAAEELEDRSRAIEEAGEGVFVIRSAAPAESAAFVAAEIERLRELAETHDAEEHGSAALSAYQDLLVWWSWFPELIPAPVDDGPTPLEAVRKRISELETELRAPDEAPGTAARTGPAATER